MPLFSIGIIAIAGAAVAGLALTAARKPGRLLLQAVPLLAGWGAAGAVAAAVPAVFSPLAPEMAVLLLVTAEYGVHLLAAPTRAAARAARLPVWMGALAGWGAAAVVIGLRTPDGLRAAATLAVGGWAAAAVACWLLPRAVPAAALLPMTRFEDRAAPRPARVLIPAAAAGLAGAAALAGVPGGAEMAVVGVLAPAAAAGLLVVLATLRWEAALAAAAALGMLLAAVWGGLAWFSPAQDLGALGTVLAAQGIVFALGRELAAYRGAPAYAGSARVTAAETGAAAAGLAIFGRPALGAALLVIAAAVLAAGRLVVPALLGRVLPADPTRPPRTLADRLGFPPPSPARRLLRAIKSRYAFQGARVEQYIHWKTLLDPVYSQAAAHLPAEGLILDLGCGYGLMSHWAALSAPGRRLWGLDLDPRKLAVAERTAQYDSRLAFVRGDLLAADLPPARAALLLDILHYSAPEVQIRMLARAARALEPGGWLIVCETCLKPGRFSWAAFWDGFSMRIGFNPSRGGMHLADAAGWARRFAAAGLRVDAAEPCGGSRRLFRLVRA